MNSLEPILGIPAAEKKSEMKKCQNEEANPKIFKREFILWCKNCVDVFFWADPRERAAERKNRTVLSNVQNDYGRHITKQLQPNNIYYQNCRAHYTHVIYFYGWNRSVRMRFRSQLCASDIFMCIWSKAPRSKMFIEVYCWRKKNRLTLKANEVKENRMKRSQWEWKKWSLEWWERIFLWFSGHPKREMEKQKCVRLWLCQCPSKYHIMDTENTVAYYLVYFKRRHNFGLRLTNKCPL